MAAGRMAKALYAATLRIPQDLLSRSFDLINPRWIGCGDKTREAPLGIAGRSYLGRRRMSLTGITERLAAKDNHLQRWNPVGP